MKMTAFSDYAFRVMVYAAAKDGQPFTNDEMNAVLRVSRTHLRKVVNKLTQIGYLKSSRGRGGGLRLGMPAVEISLGALFRHTENSFGLVECMRGPCECTIATGCKLPPILNQATEAFLSVLDSHTLEDVRMNPDNFNFPKEAKKP